MKASLNFRSKTNKVNNKTLDALAARVIDTVIKSGNSDAKVSKRFLLLLALYKRYRQAILLGDEDQLKLAVKAIYKLRSELFAQMYGYLEGLTNSPDADMKAAAILLFRQVNRFGKSFSKLRLADQTTQYRTIIEALNRPEFTIALVKTLLTDKLSAIEQSQGEYEQLYTGFTDINSVIVAPTTLRKELIESIIQYVEEVNILASQVDTPEWYSMCSNLQNRFDEVSITTSSKSKTEVAVVTNAEE